MIVVFGATTGIGQRLAFKLKQAGHAVRMVSRSEGDENANLASGSGMSEAMRNAAIVVSCAHAKFTGAILAALPGSVRSVVLTGSAWRYSKVPNERADQVRSAEALFLASQRDGVMMHPTMIYGGSQENNIRRLLSLIKRLPVIPAPGGGHQIVQPIYIEDLVDCLFAAVIADWKGANVIAVGGQPLAWREMVQVCAAAIGRSKPIINVPAFPIVAALSVLNKLGIKTLDSNAVRRFNEDVNVPLADMATLLSIYPRDFESGLRLAVANWQREGDILFSGLNDRQSDLSLTGLRH
jgi:nucleoside-diphosphate-sugar epimerase